MGLLLYLNIVKTQHDFHGFSFWKEYSFLVLHREFMLKFSHSYDLPRWPISAFAGRFLTLDFHVCLVLNLWHGSLDMTFHLDLYLHRASNAKYVTFTQPVYFFNT